jgi:endonuclease/exonuclease/phosphatase family metal-dependent hydrolase
MKAALFLGVLSVLFVLGFASGTFAETDKSVVTVMTRNMDAGTDLNYVLGATNFEDFVTGLGKTVAEVLASDIPGRAAGLAAEISAARPDVVALQEVTTWRIQVGQDALVLDQLDLLMQALAAAHLKYRIAVVQTLSDIAVPGFVEYTDHDAILVRTDLPPGHLEVLGTESHVYEHLLSFSTPASDNPIPVLRGWIAADLKVRGARFKFANTHLESIIPTPQIAFELTAALQGAQGMELLLGLQAAGMPVILAGDFNSDAELAGVGPDQSLTAAFITQNGYTDAWRALHPTPSDTGFTWPLFLEDQPGPPTVPATPVERIDLIFSLGPTPTKVEQTGATPGLGGIYASDHVGVVATFAVENFRR